MPTFSMLESKPSITTFFYLFLWIILGWNVLDFIVVVMGILELSKLGTYAFIRCFRVLRPLRVITKIDSLKVVG